MPHRNVQVIGIIVGNRLPIERAGPEPNLLECTQILKAIGLNLFLIGRHDLGDRRYSRLKRDEEESAPVFQCDRK